MFLLWFILPGTLCASWTSLTFFPMLGKFSGIISSDIFSRPFSLSSPFGTPIMWMLSQRSLRLSSFPLIPFSIFCSVVVISPFCPPGHVSLDLPQNSYSAIDSCHFLLQVYYPRDFPGGSDGKVSAYKAGDLGLIPGSGRSSGEGNGTPLQYSCLENPMDGRAW